ncbi:hypothetical protein TNCV_2296021 [Trichonephila clavipes]|nr:hypothetical protein TNCV_2296021 [Trichonephila clavipes]
MLSKRNNQRLWMPHNIFTLRYGSFDEAAVLPTGQSHELKPSATEHPPCRGDPSTLNLSRLKRHAFGVVWKTATAGSDVVQSGRPIFDDFFQHLWPYIGNNTANVVFQMVKRLWLIRIDQ